MKNKLIWMIIITFLLGMLAVIRITGTLDRKVNQPAVPIVIEKRVNILEIINAVKIVPYGERLQVTHHNPEGCDDYSWYNPGRYVAYSCSDLQGVGTVSVRYNFPNIIESDILRDGDTAVVNLGSPTFILELSEKDIIPINQNYGIFNSTSNVLKYSRKSKILLEQAFLVEACERKFFDKAIANLNVGLASSISELSGQKVRFEASPVKC